MSPRFDRTPQRKNEKHKIEKHPAYLPAKLVKRSKVCRGIIEKKYYWVDRLYISLFTAGKVLTGK